MLLSLTFRFIIRFSIIREKAGRVKEFTQKIGTDFIDKRSCTVYNKNIKRTLSGNGQPLCHRSNRHKL